MDTQTPKSKRKWLKYSLLSLLGVVLIALGAFVWWGLTPLKPSAEALNALKNTEMVTVSHHSEGWTFTPAKTTPTTGYIFYLGGHVDARSYAVYAHEIAERGYLVAIPEMPLSLAVFGMQKASDVIQANPAITKWVIGGHSLGGVMAASYAAAHSDKVSGLVLLAAYPATGTDLSKQHLNVLSMYGTEDTVLNHVALQSAKPLLPARTNYVELEGGNHGQFGSYGIQPGDTATPAMSAAEQRVHAVTATLSLLQQ